MGVKILKVFLPFPPKKLRGSFANPVDPLLYTKGGEQGRFINWKNVFQIYVETSPNIEELATRLNWVLK